MVAFSVSPLLSTISMSPLTPGSTTWLFVRTWPLPSMTKPDPVADPSLPASTLMVTTLGRATAAMLATEPAGRCVAPGPGSGKVVPARLMRSSATWLAMPPMTPESRHRPMTAATTLPRPRRADGAGGSESATLPGGTGPLSRAGSPPAGAWGTEPRYDVPPGAAAAPASTSPGWVDAAGPVADGASAVGVGGAYAERWASSARESARSLPQAA